MSKDLWYPSGVDFAFPLEEVSWNILRRVDARGFDVPGINVIWGQMYDTSLTLRGQDFALCFGQVQKRIAEPYGPPILVRAATPGNELTFYHADRLLTFAKYAAYTDWVRDRDWFLDDSLKCHGQAHGLPRFLRYKSRCDCSELEGAIFSGIEPLVAYMTGKGTLPPQNTLHTHRDRWACPLLVFDNHYKTEYEPIEGHEPTICRTDEVMAEMYDWLSQLLSAI